MTMTVDTQSATRLTASDEDGDATLAAHERRHGAVPLPRHHSAQWGDDLLAEIERAGLTGRGGAGFPSFRKQRLVLASARPVLVVNAMEGEPASRKDRWLVSSAPHLILDGAELVATALQAPRIVLCVPDDGHGAAAAFGRALRERDARGGGVGGPRGRAAVEIRRLPGRYVTGEESALVAGAGGATAVPAHRPNKSVPLRLGRQTALVHNVETLAHVALIARYGADWFRRVGAAQAPGTCLVTVSGAVERPGVFEVATGTPVSRILEPARPTGPLQGVLVGGYGGTWISGDDAATPYEPVALGQVGASMGAGVLGVLPAGACGIRETARIARFMAGESAGQCGPCLFGLPAIAADLEQLADGRAGPQTLDRLLDRCGAVQGRGACRHPDGVVRLVRSALGVFAADARTHAAAKPCAGSRRPATLPGLGSNPGGR